MTNLQIQTKQLSELTLLETNPRQISKEKFQKLKDSIQKDKEFLNSRPILCYLENGKLIIYAGNQRYRACKELGMTEVPVIVDYEATPETIKNRVILDNIEFGDWDFDVLANNWELEDLKQFKGLDSLLDFKLDEIDVEDIDFSDKNKEIEPENLGNESVLTFKFSHQEYMNILDLLNNAKEKLGCDTNEQTLIKLLSDYE